MVCHLHDRGLGVAALSAAAFGTSGTFATSLLRAGWSPAAAVLVRISVATLVLAVPAARAARSARLAGAPLAWRRRGPGVVAYGVVAVAGCQLCYFEAVARMSAAPALLLEYSGTLLVVAWMWLRHGQRPGRLVGAGAAASVAGLVLIIGVGSGVRVSAAGVAWGLAAAVGLAGFFVLSAGGVDAQEGGDTGALPPLVVACGGMVVGACGLGLAAACGVVPLHATTAVAVLAGRRVSWVVPVVGLSVIAAALAYVTGVAAARALGARVSSFLGLAEVLFSAVYAWLALGEGLSATQLVGGVAVLVGIALVRLAEPAAPASSDAPAIEAGRPPDQLAGPGELRSAAA